MRFTSTAAVISAVVAGATLASAASIPPQHLESRDVAPSELTDLTTRDVSDVNRPRSEEFSGMEAREVLEELIARADSSSALEEFFTRDLLEELVTRSEVLEELYTREPNKVKNFFKKVGKGIGGVFKGLLGFRSLPEDELMTREVMEELFEREFDPELFERELDAELFEREPDAELFEREPDAELFERDFDAELYERGLWDEDVEVREFIMDDLD
ncbi:hypothetical protein CC1G_12507 [Coprinopsis cinerea okayama7|uniref:Uncharacterized protein n=1 Tax=Coprinopsis cinerea (strain Okayama-7 / 130 / ATCC MYA-4618 / FGSC 9003) TaxID=240176 RepID=A8PAF4_COPC7|nr:hypothetical protein CC1G_12507 [Coprinopsis cinerea okayama7\|eukprot:XP_001839978.1 hypothetical protein CC1G_12507 [Coprinopsis cinerea okayama7\